MKRTILAAVCLLPFAGVAHQKYLLEGQISNLPGAGMAYLIYHSPMGLVTDSAQIEHGKFRLSAPIASITEANLALRQGAKILDQTMIYLEPKTMKMVAAAGDLKNALITGSPVNDDHRLLKQALKPTTDRMDALMKKWRSTPDKERMDTTFRRQFAKEQMQVELDARAIKKAFALPRFNSYVGLIAYLESGAMNFDQDFEGFVRDFNKFSPEVRATNTGRNLQEKINGFLKTKVGLKAMDFVQKDVNGKPVRLSDFKGKYVLLDFWASWCGPCRAETPHLVKAYAHYKNRKFEILSVSLDKADARAAWLKAIEKDGMTWTNVSDLRYWRNEAAIAYGIKTVPANFLIDPSGKIIAKDLRGEELEKKLAEILD